MDFAECKAALAVDIESIDSPTERLEARAKVVQAMGTLLVSIAQSLANIAADVSGMRKAADAQAEAVDSLAVVHGASRNG